jgi:hypothetical protein
MRSFIFEGDEMEGSISTGNLASKRKELKMWHNPLTLMSPSDLQGLEIYYKLVGEQTARNHALRYKASKRAQRRQAARNVFSNICFGLVAICFCITALAFLALLALLLDEYAMWMDAISRPGLVH